MTDTGVASEQNKRTAAAAAAQRCLDSFNECLLHASSIHGWLIHDRLEVQVMIFSTWTTDTRAFAPGQASMDHRLRYAPEVHNRIIDLLEALNCHIQKLLKVLRGQLPSGETHIASVLTEELGVSSGHIAAEVRRLNKSSKMIRKASQESQSIHAKAVQITDEEENYAEPPQLSRLKRYFAERFPNASVALQQELAEALISKSEELLHWESPYELAPTQLQYRDLKVPTTLQPEKFKMAASSSSPVSDTMMVAFDNHEALLSPTAPRPKTKRSFAQFESEQLEVRRALLRKVYESSSATNPKIYLDVEMRDAQDSSSSKEQLSHILKSDVPATCENYMNHMRDAHETNPDGKEVDVLANSFQELFLPRPPCDQNEPQISSCLKDPIARYSKSPASGSLPRDYDNISGDVASDKYSPNNLQRRNRSTINGLDNESIPKSPHVTNEDLDDVAVPDTLANSDGKGLADEFLKRDKTHSDPVCHSGHVMIDKAEVISPELSDEQIGQKVKTQPEHGINSSFDMDSNDMEMEDV
ncbi:uncharacterized protein Triagg1_6326 [Trichoderma aggressivum f. europaeum]|uniref:Uncharacterized protein n=1 Tax=Trichoderma aggressivum f. europaeum TaxID=173218 RepID=A0AAE1M1R6_9HYPO|nr:hypothetical protein Triagg1_6326 [Trichoderma aggressivum f. europaeum]